MDPIILIVVGVAAVLLLQSQASQGTSSLASLMASLLKSSGSGKSGGGSSGGGSGGGNSGGGTTASAFNLGTYLQNLQTEGASDGTPGITQSSDYGYIASVPGPQPVIVDQSANIEAALAADYAGGGGGGGAEPDPDTGGDYGYGGDDE